jgi:hypothetical protein
MTIVSGPEPEPVQFITYMDCVLYSVIHLSQENTAKLLKLQLSSNLLSGPRRLA